MAYRNGTVAASPTAVTSIVTTGILTVSGDTGVICFQTTQSQPISGSVVDSKGNTWTQVAGSPYAVGGTTFYMYILTCQNMIGGAGHTVQINISGGSVQIVLHFNTYSGILTSGTLLDGTSTPVVDTSFIQVHPGAAITTAKAGSTLVEFCFNQNNATEVFTAGSGLTIATQALGSANTYVTSMVQHQVGVAAGSHPSVGWSTNNNNESGSFLIALTAAGDTPITPSVGSMVLTGNTEADVTGTLITPITARRRHVEKRIGGRWRQWLPSGSIVCPAWA